MYEIIDGLWLGAYPEENLIPKMLQANIKAILTVNQRPLDETLFVQFHRKFIRIFDEPTQNLLCALEDGLNYIESNLSEGGVYVHCTAGVSRSASMICAYIMRKNRISTEDALKLMNKRASVKPNYGFVNQLKLFHSMDYKIDKNNPAFLSYASKLVLADNYDCQTSMGSTADAAIPKRDGAVFKCGKCRLPIFKERNLQAHTRPDSAAGEYCDSELFTTMLPWFDYSDVEGKIYCTKCEAKLGSYNWCGEKCTCGSWVVPAFHFNRKNIDEEKQLPHSSSSNASTVVVKPPPQIPIITPPNAI